MSALTGMMIKKTPAIKAAMKFLMKFLILTCLIIYPILSHPLKNIFKDQRAWIIVPAKCHLSSKSTSRVNCKPLRLTLILLLKL